MSKAAFSKFQKHEFAFKPHTITHEAMTGRVFVMRSLNAREQRYVDETCDPKATVESIYKRLAASIESINGEKLPPVDDPEDYDRILELLSGPEVDELSNVWFRAFQPKGKDLKNSSTAPSSGDAPTPAR